jgi:hypothetical protein
VQPDHSNEFASAALSPPPVGEALARVLSGGLRQLLDYLLARPRTAEMIRPVPPGHQRVTVLAGCEVEV